MARWLCTAVYVLVLALTPGSATSWLGGPDKPLPWSLRYILLHRVDRRTKCINACRVLSRELAKNSVIRGCDDSHLAEMTPAGSTVLSLGLSHKQ